VRGREGGKEEGRARTDRAHRPGLRAPWPAFEPSEGEGGREGGRERNGKYGRMMGGREGGREGGRKGQYLVIVLGGKEAGAEATGRDDGELGEEGHKDCEHARA